MRYQITINGISAIITNNGPQGLDPDSEWNVEKAELTKKRGTNRTTNDNDRIKWLDCAASLYFGANGLPTFPEAGLRTCIEAGARKLRQGPLVREGLIVDSTDEFIYDRERYGTTLDELAQNCQFTVPVVVNRARVLGTRAMFDLDWAIKFTVEVDDDLIDSFQLATWLDIGGRRIGIGDWRPERSGRFGRFTVSDLTEVTS